MEIEAASRTMPAYNARIIGRSRLPGGTGAVSHDAADGGLFAMHTSGTVHAGKTMKGKP